MSKRVLILYSSRHGHTARIAERLGTALATEGITAIERDVRHAAEELVPSHYDGVIVGGSVHRGHHDPELLEWLSAHHSTLSLRPSAFFSVSLTAADDTAEARGTTQALIDDVLDATGWIPSMTAAFAGALLWREYDLPTRVLMRLIARQHGEDVDVGRDVVYTDWDAVDRFGHELARRVKRAAAQRAAAATG